MILQTGQRTDIPAFYSEWFVNRVKEGYVLVRNPYNPQAVTRYNINPDVVDLIVFCTKNPLPMLDKMDILNPFGQYWFVTITPYGRDIEPAVPDKMKVMEGFKKLSERLGSNCMGWRYDPIFISEEYSVDRHIYEFEIMAKELSGYTGTCVISFIDLFEKVKKNFPEVKPVTKADREKLGRAFTDIGRKYGFVIKPCAEGDELSKYGADCSGCATLETFETVLGARLDAPKLKPGRKECACLITADIGAYNSCGHGCKYCYANFSDDTVRRNMAKHNKNSPFLIGGSLEGDVIHQADQRKWRVEQMSIFDFIK